jgi:hypothetical protein
LRKIQANGSKKPARFVLVAQNPNFLHDPDNYSGIPREDLLIHKAREAEMRSAEMRAQQAAQEMAECTFAPAVNHRGRATTAGNAGPDPAQVPPRSEILYQHFLRKKAAFDQGQLLEKTSLDKEVEEHCTFQPQVELVKIW